MKHHSSGKKTIRVVARHGVANGLILYFYLKTIKGDIIRTRALQKTGASNIPKATRRKKVQQFLRKAGIAALTTILIFFTVVYVNTGKVLVGINTNSLVELAAAFLFLVGLFWAHGRISKIVNSPGFRRLHSTIRPVLEIVLVIVTTVILVYLLNYLPLKLFFAPEEFLPERLRNAFVLSIIISLFFYYFVERERSKRELQAEMLHSARLQKENFEAQLQSLKNQVNPHFLFNSLNVLGSLIQRDQEQAEEFVRRLSDVYRSFLDSSNKTLIPLEKEIEVAEAYIYLLKTRSGDAVHFNIEVPTSKLSDQIPPGSLQMLIENAVKHNGSTGRNPLLVEIFVEEDRVIVRNKLQPRKGNVSSTKLGLENIKSRYRFLTERKVEIIKTDDAFTVKLPLLNTEEYEDSHH